MNVTASKCFWVTAGLAWLLAVPVQAQVSTSRSSSLLFFPKVIADGTSDTTIQIANTTSQLRSARCFYVRGVPDDPNAPPPPSVRVVDFRIFLTSGQPTHWLVSRGRQVNPSEAPCDRDNLDCVDAGYDPGRIPAVGADFRGYAFCVETDASGLPVPGNALVGRATVTDLVSGDVAGYTAVGLRGLDVNDSNNTLCLGGNVSAACPNGAEYHGCPAEWYLHHATEGGEDPVAGPPSSTGTTITIAACPQDLLRFSGAPATTLVQLVVTNEFEQPFVASISVDGWVDVPLASISNIFEKSVLASDTALARITTAGNDEPGFVVVAQTFRHAGGTTTSAGLNLKSEGVRRDADRILLPPAAE